MSKSAISRGKPIIAVTIFVVLSTAVTVSMSPLLGASAKIYASAQTVSQGTNNQNLTNTTQSPTNVTNNNNSFLAEGTIDQLIPFSPSTTGGTEGPFLLGGDWVLSVNDGRVDDFGVRIVMVAEDGTLLHVHSIQNLTNVTSRISPIGVEQQQQQQQPSRPDNNISLSADPDDAIAISGFADITTNGVTEWQDVAVTITITNGNVISIIPNPGEIDHFYALPIYGIVRSLVDDSGQSLRDQQLTNNATLASHGRGAVDFNYGNGDTGVNNSSPVKATDNDLNIMTQISINEDAGTGNVQPVSARGFSVPEERTAESLSLNSTASPVPIVEQVSDNQNYLVQLRWTPYGLSLPLNEISYTIYFLDAQQPRSTEELVPPWESNYTGFSRASPSLFIDPYILNFEPVDSYDMTVYSDTGSILWQEDDLKVYGGRDWGALSFAERYSGPITIEITDIKLLEGFAGTNNMPMPDSVTFPSLVVE